MSAQQKAAQKAPIMVDADLAEWLRQFSSEHNATMQSVGSNLLRAAITVLGDKPGAIPGVAPKRAKRVEKPKPELQDRRAGGDRRSGDERRKQHWTR